MSNIEEFDLREVENKVNEGLKHIFEISQSIRKTTNRKSFFGLLSTNMLLAHFAARLNSETEFDINDIADELKLQKKVILGELKKEGLV